MLETITERQCTKCGIIKSLLDFNKQKMGKYGVRTHCKICLKEHYNCNKEHITKRVNNYRNANKEIIAVRKKTYYEANKNKVKEYKRQYQINNKEFISERKKEYQAKNKERIADYKKKYCATEKGRASINNSANKRRLLKNKGDVTTQQLLELQQNSKVCYWCNASLKNKKPHIDHYVPLSKGGEHTIRNLVISCSKCNLSKGAIDPLDFARSKGRLL